MPFLPDAPSLYWLLAPVLIFGRYWLLCTVVFLLFYVVKRRDWLRRKIQQRFPKNSDYRREIGYSALTSLIFAAVALFTIKGPLRPYTQYYTDVNEHGWGWLLLSVPLILLLHDAYFYWMHRLMHHPRLYRRMHLVHHRSVNPSPWAAYAFHPWEAVAEAGIIPLALLVLPVHPLAFFAFISVMLWFNVYGHLGYELFPRWLYEHPLGRWINSSVYHNLHHERVRGNYGLYFTFWDRWMGTLRTETVDEVHATIGQRATRYALKRKNGKATVARS